MDVVFIHRGGPDMASYRYRADMPAAELRKRGINAHVNKGTGQVAIFSKPMDGDVELAKDLKSKGVCIITDLGDNHFKILPSYREMLDLSHYQVCPTEVMATIQRGMGADPVVIPDPYELELKPPHRYTTESVGYSTHRENQPPGVLWFGHNTNLKDIDFWRPTLAHYDFKVVTGPRIEEHQILYSLDSMTEALSENRFVIFPTRKGAENKTANRMINVLRAGRFPICSPHPSYDEFRKMVWVGDIHTGLKWATHFKEDLTELIAQGQEYIEKYSPANVGGQWQAFLESI